MKKAILAQKVLASVLAIGLGGFVLPLAAQANSGLSDKPQDVTGLSDKYYIGTNGAADNVVIIDRDLPSEEDSNVIGGYAEKDNAVNNRITISSGISGIIEGFFNGGYAASGNATDNIINISGGRLEAAINGGRTTSGNATDNVVNITGGDISCLRIESGLISVHGGGLYGGEAVGEESIVAGNSVNISGEASIKDFSDMATIGGGIARGKNSQVTGNRVTVSGGAISSSGISGGKADEENSIVEGNSVTVSGGTISSSSISGGKAAGESSTVEGNSVTVSGGTLWNIDIYGGSEDGEKSTVKGNSVTICGGMVKGEVYGGYVENGENDSTVKDNSVTLLDGAELNEADLYGGIILDWLKNDIGSETTVKDNKLIINGWSGTVQSINNFNGDDGGIEVKALAGGLDLAAGKATNFITVTGREVKGENEEDVNHIYIENSYI